MNSKKLRIYIPVFLVFFIFLFFFSIYIRSLIMVFQSLAISMFYAVGAGETSRWAVLKSRKTRPGLNHTEKRVLLILRKIIPSLLLVPAGGELFTFVVGYNSINSFKVLLLLWDYIYMMGVGTLCSLIVVSLYEGIYYIENWKTTFAESERLKKINLNSQYQFLKDQVKPHFLFNSLNTLASLISADPARAEQFVVEMSAVYRYLLTKKEKEFALLRDELDFLHSYVLMLKTRFAESLQVNIDVSQHYFDFLLPPFVLQLLVENAVKHNIVSREKPLYVSIASDAHHHLIVSNNIQRKPKPEPSEKTGLTNLITHYQLLKMDHRLLITDEEGVFKVVLPLIETNIYEHVDG